MSTIPRDAAQMLIEKLDLGHASVTEAKKLAWTYYGVRLAGRTRKQVVREIGQAIEKPMGHYESAITGTNEKRRDQLIAGFTVRAQGCWTSLRKARNYAKKLAEKFTNVVVWNGQPGGERA